MTWGVTVDESESYLFPSCRLTDIVHIVRVSALDKKSSLTKLLTTARRVSLHVVLVSLVTTHYFQKKISFNASFGVSIGSHVSSIAPLDRFNEFQLE